MATEQDIDIFATAAYRIMADYFDITLYRPQDKLVVFWGNPRLRKRGWKRKLNQRLDQIRARAVISRDRQQYRIEVQPSSGLIRRPPLLNVLLFILTFLTVLIAAAYREVGDQLFKTPDLAWRGLTFTLTLLFILLVHEMGHFIAGHRRRVIMSYPFFIPAPSFLGTFGALIKSRTPITNRNDLILIGAAGPLAGAIPSIIALLIGLHFSTYVSHLPEPGLIWGDSILTWLARLAILGPIPTGYHLYHSPVALAGHVGLLVTMINLLPLGQLDGGHILYGLFESTQKMLAWLFITFLLLIGFLWMGWWVWMVLAIIFKPYHPPVIYKDILPDSRHKKIGWSAVFLFIITFVPIPIS